MHQQACRITKKQEGPLSCALVQLDHVEFVRAGDEKQRTLYSGRTPRGKMLHLASVAPAPPLSREADLFQEMFLSSRTRFVSLAYSILQNNEDAEDAVQDAFVSGCVHAHAFEGRSAFATWFTRIVLNAAFMIRRKRKHSRLCSLPESCSRDAIPWVEKMAGPHPDPEKIYVRKEACELLNVLSSQLKPVLRQALDLTYLCEMSSSEAAATLGVSVTTFKSRVLRARRLLTKRVAVNLTLLKSAKSGR
jgi:RNA polymerase sigma-70 factor (ECF subfamily)